VANVAIVQRLRAECANPAGRCLTLAIGRVHKPANKSRNRDAPDAREASTSSLGSVEGGAMLARNLGGIGNGSLGQLLCTSLIACGALACTGDGTPIAPHVRAQQATATSPFINEIHYDNTGTDADEAVEIAGPAGTDLSGYQLVLYNGANGASYGTLNLTGVIADQDDGFGTLAFNYAANGIQNGSPDGVALVGPGNVVVQFLSYEGTFAAVGGPADGMTSVDIGVSETGSEPLGQSLQLVGSGTSYDQFHWAPAATASRGAINPGQDFIGGQNDAPPSVTQTVPADSATDVDTQTSIAIVFSEPVAVAPDWFAITCSTSGPHAAAVAGGPQSYTLLPDNPFAIDETCTVSVSAAQVTDLDETPDPMSADFSFGFATITQPICGGPATPIHDVQGSGSASPLIDQVVTIEGVVVGDFQGSAGLGGFFVQEEDAHADGDPLTSEGIFVYQGNTGVAVNLGDVVRVTGKVAEYYDLTELSNVTDVRVCGSGATATPATVSLPAASSTSLEAFEGMRVTLPQTLYATETYTVGRYGEVALSANARLFQPTNVVAPGAPAQALQAANNLARIQLDDGSNTQNPPVVPYLGPDNTLRIGDTLAGLTGVLGYAFGTYEIHPSGGTSSVQFTRANPRTDAPTNPGGSLKVAGFNVLNYFTTLDTGAPICGPTGGLDCRGADSSSEFERQRAKILAALATIDADIVGLTELENNASASLQDLVDGLNGQLGAGTYAFIDTGTIGTDAIKVGLIYKPGRVTPVGPFAVLDSSVNPQFVDTLNRPVLAQTFAQVTNGERLTVAINHLKSKGSACANDPDTGDGQGNCNLTRTAAAQAEAAWLASDPTASGDADVLIIGDLNAYAMEDPIAAFKANGYTSLVETFVGPNAYSYVFDGQSGYLDHALASAGLSAQVVGVVEWHITADEPVVLDYNQEFNPAHL
jgi:predicted extracellular nuclease